MTIETHLEKHGIKLHRPISELTREEARARIVETAYYYACVSDSTYHGIDHGRKVDTVSSLVKKWPQFSADDFAEIDEEVDELIEERRS